MQLRRKRLPVRDVRLPGPLLGPCGKHAQVHRTHGALRCRGQAGVCRMRGFQQYLVDAGLRVQAYPFSKIIDIDHAEDIRKAELFITERGEA